MSHPRKLLESLGANALKSFSQNFLTSPHWAEKLTGEVLSFPAKAIWEIGPGLGALTDILVEKSPVPLTVYEIDRKFAERIRTSYPTVTLVEGDFLKTAPDDLPEAICPVAILSNLPYHVSSAILFKIVEWGTNVSGAVLTFQKEFAQRVKAKVGDESYAGLSVSAQYHFEIESLGILPKGAFYPEPGVDSEALKITPRKVSLEEAARFRRFVRLAFTRPRRKLGSNLREGYSPEELTSAYAKTTIDPNRRPETLSVEEFSALFLALA